MLSSRRSKELSGSLHGAGNVLLSVGRREKPCFVLRGRQVNSPIQHPVEELSKPAGVGALGRFPIGHELGRKEEREHGTDAVYGDALGNVRSQLRGALFEKIVDLGMRLQIA